jgi:hypothetical protein
MPDPIRPEQQRKPLKDLTHARSAQRSHQLDQLGAVDLQGKVTMSVRMQRK